MLISSFFKSVRTLLGVLLLTVTFGLSVTSQANAAGSGACSSHGGVDCAAGPDHDGSVICMDGWRSSSVSYRSVDKCNESGSTRTCELPQVDGCKGYFDELRLRYPQAFGMSGAYSSVTADRLALCRTEIQLFFQGAKLYNLCLELQNAGMTTLSASDSDIGCWTTYGIHSKRGSSPGTCVCDPGYTFNKAGNTCIYDLKDKKLEVDAAIAAGFAVASGPVERTAEGVCPEFSSIRGVDTFCSCNDGFFGVLSTCTVAPVYCSTRYGVGAEWDVYRKSCLCKDGYKFDVSGNKCISLFEDCTQRLGLQSVVSSGVCTCKEGATIDPRTGKCESILIIQGRGGSVVPVVSVPSNPVTPVDQTISTAPSTPKPTPKYFVGRPKTKQDLLNCAVVGVVAKKRYYLRGHTAIKTMAPTGKECFASEAAAKARRFQKVK